mgnify:CR=1 FL=1
MGQVRSQAATNSIISYSGVLLGYLNVAVLFPWMLAQEVLGLVQILMSAMLFIANLGSFGLQFIVVRFFPIFKHQGISTRVFFSFSLLISVAGIISTLTILWVFHDQIVAFYSERAALFSMYANLLYPLVVFGILAILIDSYSRAIMRSVLTAFYKEVVVRVLQLLAVLFFFYNITSLDTFLWIYVSIQGLYLLMMYASVARYSDIRLSIELKPIRKKLLGEIAKYGGVSIFSTSAFLANNSDILLVGTFVGLKETAVYGVASAIGRVIGVPARAITRVATSVVAEAWSKNRLDKIQDIYEKSAINNLIVGGILLLGVVINTDLFLSLIPESYGGARPVILLLSISKIVMMATGINGPIITASKHYWVNMINNLGSFVTLLISAYLLIQWMGMIGAAWASLIVALTGNLFKYSFLKVKYNMEFITWSYLKVLTLLFLLVIAGILLPAFGNIWIDASIKTISMIGAFVWIVYKLHWSDDFTDMMQGISDRLKRML